MVIKNNFYNNSNYLVLPEQLFGLVGLNSNIFISKGVKGL